MASFFFFFIWTCIWTGLIDLVLDSDLIFLENLDLSSAWNLKFFDSSLDKDVARSGRFTSGPNRKCSRSERSAYHPHDVTSRRKAARRRASKGQSFTALASNPERRRRRHCPPRDEPALTAVVNLFRHDLRRGSAPPCPQRRRAPVACHRPAPRGPRAGLGRGHPRP